MFGWHCLFAPLHTPPPLPLHKQRRAARMNMNENQSAAWSAYNTRLTMNISTPSHPTFGVKDDAPYPPSQAWAYAPSRETRSREPAHTYESYTNETSPRLFASNCPEPRLHGNLAPTPPRFLPCPPKLKPRKIIPLPAQVPGITSVRMHPALASETHLALDLASPADIHTASRQYSSEPATYLGLPSLTISSPRLPWVITAHGQASGNVLRCVTVADVLIAIHQALLLRVSERQFAEVMYWRGGKCPRRSGRGGMTFRYSPGMTRMHLLEGKTTFQGLSPDPSEMGCDFWVFEVS